MSTHLQEDAAPALTSSVATPRPRVYSDYQEQVGQVAAGLTWSQAEIRRATQGRNV
jgi:hypothetical protein